MKFEIDIPESVIEEAVLKAICEHAVRAYEECKIGSGRRIFEKYIKAAAKEIVEASESDLINRAVQYAGDKLVRDKEKRKEDDA